MPLKEVIREWNKPDSATRNPPSRQCRFQIISQYIHLCTNEFSEHLTNLRRGLFLFYFIFYIRTFFLNQFNRRKGRPLFSHYKGSKRHLCEGMHVAIDKIQMKPP